ELESIKISSKVNRDVSGVFQVVDVAGQLDSQLHPLRDMTTVAFGAVDVIILLFSTDNVQSLLDLARWIDIIKQYYVDSKYDLPSMILVKNKIDLNETIDEVLVDTLMKYDSDVVQYFEVSCMTGAGFDEISDWLVTNCFAIESPT
ncbi:MAG: GTPase domain-containing protein, partial [Candidatus Thorarchaeota archaeon]